MTTSDQTTTNRTTPDRTTPEQGTPDRTTSERGAAHAGPTDADQAAIAALPQRMIAGWAAHDAAAVADLFTDDGVMILPGLYRRGREEIREFLATAYEGPYRGTTVTGTPLDLRLFGADLGILVTQGGVVAPGDTEVTPERAIRASWVAVRQDGEWRLATYQNSPVNT
ncbi:SgcJ/EcaC family oxidoreductase [Actinosynnema sp. NPDC023587]|uniref:SgcJ/EcaC family oxidoreductase n=1 Tax=Actinosynnema sp. NPDC023587 TaxID=3154695 RepID=UPI0033D61EDF